MTDPAISPDGKLVAAGHSDKRVYVWDLESGQTRFLLEGHAGQVTGVDFSPNGRYLASGSRDGTVRLWSLATGQLVRVITGLRDNVTGVKFSDDGRRLIIYVSGQSAEVWDMQTGRLGELVEPEATPDPFSLYMHQQGYTDSGWTTLTLFSPDGHNLAVARGNVLVWDVVTHELVAALEGVGTRVARIVRREAGPEHDRFGVDVNAASRAVFDNIPGRFHRATPSSRKDKTPVTDLARLIDRWHKSSIIRKVMVIW